MSSISSQLNRSSILNPSPTVLPPIQTTYVPQVTDRQQQQDGSTRSTVYTDEPERSSFSISHDNRKPVAKKACLACREKKVKCDGELQTNVPLPGTFTASGAKAVTTTIYNRCTNCFTAGLKCVYVASKRGGRRRKIFSNESIASSTGLQTEGSKESGTIEKIGQNEDSNCNKRQHTTAGSRPHSRHHNHHHHHHHNPSQSHYYRGQSESPRIGNDVPSSVNGGTSYLASSPIAAQQHQHQQASAWGAKRPFYLPPPYSKDSSSVSGVSKLTSKNGAPAEDSMSEYSEGSSVPGRGSYPYYGHLGPSFSHHPGHHHHHPPPSPPPPFHHFSHPLPPPPFHHFPPPPPPFHYGFGGYPPPPPPPGSHYPGYENPKSGVVSSIDRLHKDNGSIAPSDSVTSVQAKRLEAQVSTEENKSHYSDTTEDWVKRQSEYQKESSQPEPNSGAARHYESASQTTASSESNGSGTNISSSNQAVRTKSRMSMSRINNNTSTTESNTGSTLHLRNIANNGATNNTTTTSRSALMINEINSSPTTVVMPPRVTEDELLRFGLPNWNTCHILIKLFYKYVHTSHLVLPNKNLFVNKLTISEESAALLCCMFRMAVKFLSPNEVRDPSILNEEHWIQVGQRYEQDLTLRTELSIQTLTCYMNDDDQLLSCFRSIKASNYLEVFKTKTMVEYKELLDCATERQMVDREGDIRIVWNVYKFQIYRRINFGYPYKIDNYFKFPKSLELPMKDIDYYTKTQNPSCFKSIYQKVLSLNQINLNNLASSPLYDSVLLIISCHLAEEVMNAISRDALIPGNILKYDSQIQRVLDLDAIKPYTIDKQNKFILINANLLLSKFMNNLTLTILHSSLSQDLLLFQPKQTKEGQSNLTMMNDLPDNLPSPSTIPISKEIQQWKSIFSCIFSSFEIISLLELGEGICPETLSMNTIYQTTVGPCSINEDETWVSMDSKLVKVSTIQSTNETWMQYPLFALTVVCQSIPIIASFILILKNHEFKLVDNDEDTDNNDGSSKNVVVVRDGETLVEFKGVDTSFVDFVEHKLKRNVLLEKFRVATRYLESVSHYFGVIKVASIQADKLLEYLLSV